MMIEHVILVVYFMLVGWFIGGGGGFTACIWPVHSRSLTRDACIWPVHSRSLMSESSMAMKVQCIRS